jgi:hypothetical protein
MSSLQNKLYNYAESPPKKTWEKIAAALDESNLADEFPSKLYNAEAVPPASAWDKIASSLDAEHPVVIPMPRKSFPLFRYAAAAAIIGIITFGIIKWTGTNNSQIDTKKLAGTKDSTPGNKETVLPNENNIVKNNTSKENISSEESNAKIANTNQVKTTHIKKARNSYSVSENIDATQPIYAYNEYGPNLADRYIMLMTPNGNIIRMSKKWGDLVCCVSGEEQDNDCKDQLKKWQEKIAASPVAPSPGNFMDILSLVSSLSDTDL